MSCAGANLRRNCGAAQLFCRDAAQLLVLASVFCAAMASAVLATDPVDFGHIGQQNRQADYLGHDPARCGSVWRWKNLSA